MPRGRGRRSSNTNASPSSTTVTDDINDDASLDATTTSAADTKMSTSPTNAANAAAAAATPAATAPPTKPLPEQFAEFLTTLDNLLIKYPTAQQLKEKTGVRPVLIALCVAALVLLFVLFGVGAAAVCNLTGFVYPLYASFKALKSPEKGDDTQWLTYWMVYAFFSFLESFTDILLRWIPFYYVFKVAFLIWCYLPQTHGANVVYKKFIFPIFIKHEREIDEGIRRASAKFDEQVEGAPKKTL